MMVHIQYVPLKCNVTLAQQDVARCTLEFDVYYLKSASLQLKSRSTLGLQQNFYKARLFNLIICYKAFHHCKYLPSRVYLEPEHTSCSITPSIVLPLLKSRDLLFI